VILALSSDAATVKSAVDKAVDDFAARGFRALGVARAEGDGEWKFQGVLPLFDPPRDDAKATVATAEKMGVKVKMVTGDALAIAKEMAKKLGMGTTFSMPTSWVTKSIRRRRRRRRISRKPTASHRYFPSINSTSWIFCRSTATSSA
jgi:magnesium-transporting ATPase (P-type)